MRRTLILAAAIGLLLVAAVAFALDADDLSDLVGFTIVSATNVDGEFEGAEFDKLVKLQNGMIFSFLEYNYTYSYSPSVVVLAEHITAAQMLSAGIKDPPSRGRTTYKLIIEDEIYDVVRVR